MNNLTKVFTIVLVWLTLWNLNIQHQYSQIQEHNKKLLEEAQDTEDLNLEYKKSIQELQEKNNKLEEEKELISVQLKQAKQKQKEYPPTKPKNKPKIKSVTRGGVGIPPHKNFKAYMDYRTITNTQSKQYQLQKQAYTDNAGFRRLGNAYMIALGSYWGNVGDYVTIEMGDTTIQCIIGDQKADIHTDSMNRLHFDNSLLEFIIDINQLSSSIKQQGDCSANPLVNFRSPVTNIY